MGARLICCWFENLYGDDTISPPWPLTLVVPGSRPACLKGRGKFSGLELERMGARFGTGFSSTIGTLSVGKGDMESQNLEPLANRELEIWSLLTGNDFLGFYFQTE